MRAAVTSRLTQTSRSIYHTLFNILSPSQTQSTGFASSRFVSATPRDSLINSRTDIAIASSISLTITESQSRFELIASCRRCCPIDRRHLLKVPVFAHIVRLIFDSIRGSTISCTKAHCSSIDVITLRSEHFILKQSDTASAKSCYISLS